MSATNRGAKRNAYDLYPTPLESFTPLFPYLSKDAEYWDPCCGDGRLVASLRQAGYVAGGADLRPNPWKQQDYLLDVTKRDVIITNPPFSLAQEFITHSLKHSRETYMLLRLNFLGAKKRRAWWPNHKHNAYFVLTSRPDFTGEGGDACEYAWFYWGRRWQGPHWL